MGLSFYATTKVIKTVARVIGVLPQAPSLDGLGFKAVEARLENLLEQASKREPGHADFLQDLLNGEVLS